MNFLVTNKFNLFFQSFQLCLVDLWLDRGRDSKAEKGSKITATVHRPMTVKFSDPVSRIPEDADNLGKNADRSVQPVDPGDLRKIHDDRVPKRPSPSSSFSLDWLPRQNEHKNLAELMEMEQTVWDKIEASGSKALLASEVKRPDLPLDEELRALSNGSSASTGLILRDRADGKVAIQMDF